MIDPLVSLAFSVYSNKGAYTLLLGSGISRASGIPTGWEVVQDLIRKVAKLEGQDCEPDPVEWFKLKHAADPDYSRILDGIAKTPTERQQLLRAYFEPTEEERSQGLKSPSPAHKAIAQIVSAGYVRVIVTTNFDRLMEKALEELGVAPTVISTPDQVAGALPLAHSGVTVIKLHGDYLDTRIKNTEPELALYDPPLSALLDRVIDEYGLIICGWSADWDIALRAAIERCPSRRFTTYWATRAPPAGHAKRLVDHRRAEVIRTRDANQLFQTLWEKVRALGELAAPHPLSTKMAVLTVKRYLVDPGAKIRLRDLIHEETEKLVTELNEAKFSPYNQTEVEPAVELAKRIEKYEALCETLISIMVTGCYWGNQQQAKLWTQCLERIANPSEITSGLVHLEKLRRYPSLLLLYGGGLAAVSARNYESLGALLIQPGIRDHGGQERALCSGVYPEAVIETQFAQFLPGLERRFTPVSDRLIEKLRMPLREYAPRDEEFQTVFDRFEYMLGLIHANLNRQQIQNGWYGPVGRFRWRGRDFPQSQIMHRVGQEIATDGANWPPLKAGLFDGDLDQVMEAKTRFDAFLKGINWH
jgi:hypothetical protein